MNSKHLRTWLSVKHWNGWSWNLWSRGRAARLTLKRGYSTFVLGEFDFHFNRMAIDSLSWHLSDACPVVMEDDRRALYEDLIARLSEAEPDTTAEESAAIDTWDLSGGETRYDKDGQVIGHCVPPCTPEASAAFDTWQVRIGEWEQRQLQARHDFVDIMRGLWS